MTEIKQIIDTLDLASDKFSTIADKQQKKMFDEVIVLTKSLEVTSEGKVKQSIANLKRLAQIKAKLAKLAQDDEWVAGIGKFLQIFSVIQNKQTAYFQSHFAEMTLTEQAKKKHQMMKEIAVQNTIDSLTGDGLKASVTDKLNDILLRAVTSGEKFADLQNELRAHLMGVDGGQGALARYAKTYATTAMTQFTGNNNKLLTQDLGLEWYMYVGSNKETTREFCEELTKKQFIHVSEIPTILKGKIDDYQCAIYPKTGLPYGMIEGTNEDNFQCNCGGWNCRHQLVPVAEAAVPANLRAKFADWKKTTEPTPQPIAEEVYKADLDSFKEYLTKHKSWLVAKDIIGIETAAAEGDSETLKILIAEAKATIAKNEASSKSKKMQNKKKVMFAHLEELKNKYGIYPWFNDALYGEISKNISESSVASFDDHVNHMVEMLSGTKVIANALILSKTMSVDKIIKLDDDLVIFNSKFEAANTYKEKQDILDILSDKYSGGEYMEAIKDFIANKNVEVQNIKIENDVKSIVAEVGDYSKAHPKSGKIIDLYNKAEEQIALGDFAKANEYAIEAKKVMKTNDSSSASKKKAKTEAKINATNIDVPDGMDEDFTQEQIKAVNEAVKSKLDAWSGLSLDKQKQKLQFEISWVENNKKYPTWKLAQSAYKKKLDEVLYQIDSQEIVAKCTILKAQNANNKEVLNMIGSVESGLKSGKTIAELQSQIVAIEQYIDKKKEEELLKKKAEAEEELKKISKDLKKSKLNQPLSDDTFWLCVSNTIKSQSVGKKLSDSDKDSIFKELKVAAKLSDRKKATELLLRLGWDADDAYGQWRRDSATWVTSGVSQSKKEFGEKSKEIFDTCTPDERKAAYDYTAGSGFMNRPLRGYDGGWGWGNFKGVGKVSLNNEKSSGEKEINDLTDLISRSTYETDVWLQRGIEPNHYGRMNDSLESFLNIRGELSDGHSRTEKDTKIVESCIGRIVTDYAFGSCGAAKGTGFSGDIINIYCPKGTKMLYLEGVSAFSGGKENEMLLQRSTSFLITKVEKMSYGNYFYIDCMVVSQDY